MRAHLLGLVREQRVEFAIALIAAHGDEYVSACADRHHFGLAAGQRSLHFELLALGQQVAADVKNGWIGLRGRGEVLIAFQDGVQLLARVFDVAGGITDSGDRTQGEEALFVALQGLNGHFDRVDSHALDSMGVVGRGASKDTAGRQDTQSTGVFHPGTCISSSIWSVM